MIKKFFGAWFIQLFCILWAAYLFLDYVNNSPYYTDSFKYFEYSGLLVMLVLLTAVIVWGISNRKIFSPAIEIKKFRGIYHYAFVLLCMSVIMFFYLSKTGITQNTIGSTFAFLFRTIGFHLALLFLFLPALSSGHFLLSLLPFTLDKNTTILVSLAIGLFAITLILFLLGSLGLLFPFVAIPLMIACLLSGWKYVFATLKSFFIKTDAFKIHPLAVGGYAFLILLIAVTLVFDTRPFPLGYDGLGLYMNTSRLIAGYHALTAGGDAYNWSIFMSLGFIIYNSTTISILISVVPGIFCLFAIYLICRNLGVNLNWSIFACALFYSLPNTIWQSRNDEKTDLALLFITLCSILLLVKDVLHSDKKSIPPHNKLLGFSPDLSFWILCGCLVGFSFGIKYVAMLTIFAFLVLIFYKYAGKYAAASIFFFNFSIIFGLDLTRFAAFESDLFIIRFLVPLLLALFFFILTLKNYSTQIVTALKSTVVFLITIGFTFLPWAIKNVSENNSFSFNSILSGKSALPPLYAQAEMKPAGNREIPGSKSIASMHDYSEIQFAGIGFKSKPKESGLLSRQNEKKEKHENNTVAESKNNSEVNDEKVEEIRRYLGYEKGIIRFLSLPYDLAMKSNVLFGASDSGIFFLMVLPIFIFVYSIRQLSWNLLKMILLLLLLTVSVISVLQITGSFDYKSAFETVSSKGLSDSTVLGSIFFPVYAFLKLQIVEMGNTMLPLYNSLTTQSLGFSFVLIVLFSIPLYFLFRKSFAELNMPSKFLVAFTFCVIQYWLILSSGIIWYGIAGFSLLPVVIALFTSNESLQSSTKLFFKRFICICAACWFFLILPFQFIPTTYLYEKNTSRINFKEFIDRRFAKYAVGEIDDRECFKQFYSPMHQNILKTLNRDKEARVLTVSVFFNYFINNNDTRVYQDNQLGIFNDIYTNAKNDRTLLAQEFKKAKIKYVFVSLNASNIDKTPDKSLTKKFDGLMRAMVNNPEVKLLYTNRIVERPDGDMDLNVGGAVVKAKHEVIGKRIIEPGTDALFEIL